MIHENDVPNRKTHPVETQEGEKVNEKSSVKASNSSDIKRESNYLHTNLVNVLRADNGQNKPNKLLNPVADHFIPAPGQSPSYRAMLQGTGTNKLTQISTRKTPPVVNAITGLATLTNDNLTVFIERYQNLTGGLRVSTHKLLDACIIALTAQNDYRGRGELKTIVSISLDEYLMLCGKPITKSSKDEMRKRVREDLDTLYNISIEWSEPDKKQTKNYAKMRVISSQGIKNGRINVGFSPEIAAYLTQAYVMQYPMDILKIDERYPSAYYIGKKLMLHHSMDNNRIRGTADIISVRALLDCCPDIPSYEEVMSSDRAVDRRIRVPFETALDMLKNTLTWNYCNGKKQPLTQDQIDCISYRDFIECYIKFMVYNEPDQSQRLLAKAMEKRSLETPKRETSVRRNKKNLPDLF